jgi:hypothetical protein
MHKTWVVGLTLAGAVACKGPSEGASPASSGAAAPVAASSAATVSITSSKVGADGACSGSLDYLVPPQKYGDSDLIRAIVVDGGQVYFRNMSELMQIPLAGGAVKSLGKPPALSLSGVTTLWASGDKLLTQSPGEPIFMSAAKTGGSWTSFIDLTAAKLGGGREAATRILQGIGKRNVPRATAADFDGQAFYFSEVKEGKLGTGAESSILKSVALAGGDARVLFQAPGEIREITRVGEFVAFLHTAQPSEAQVRQAEADRKAKKIRMGVRGESHLMAVPVAGGEAKKLMRITNWMAAVVLGPDGKNLYVSGYRDEDTAKPGIFRVDVTNGNVEQVDGRVLHGRSYVAGDNLVLIGGGPIEAGKTQHGQLVLTLPRQGKSTSIVACLVDKSTLHASAVQDKTALLSLFNGETRLASIAKVALP